MSALPHISNWVNGAHAAPSSSRIVVINPATETPIATIDATSEADVNSIIASSQQHFQSSNSWTHASASERFSVLTRAASLLRSQLADFIALEVQQTGRPIREMSTQLARVPEWLEYFSSLARVTEGHVPPFKGPLVLNTVTRVPLGVVALITPWNHPLLIAIKKLGAALAAGCSVVLKPSELAPLSVLRLGRLMQDAGLPDGALQIVCGYGRDTGRFVCASAALKRIDLTGGLVTYRAVAAVAGHNMVPVTAELGGKAPVCVLPSMGAEDAIEGAVDAALFASFIASGQTCVTGSRLLVHADIYDAFVPRLVRRTAALRLGDPTERRTQIGAVISREAVRRCEAFVERAVLEGGSVLCGGKAGGGDRGFFFEPTLVETRAGSDLSCNEVFGPVIAVIKCASEDEMVDIANGTDFALGASIWTRDFAQAHRMAEKIDAGIVWVNGHHLNDPSSPWGGFKLSGLGKENGREAYESYTKVKSTVFNYGAAPAWFNDSVENARYG